MHPPFSRTAYELLLEQAGLRPEATAAIDGDRAQSYAGLAERAGRAAGALSAGGVRRGDTVGLLANNRLEWLEVYFGAAALGATLAPFSTWSTPDELVFLIRDSGVRWIFALAGFGDQQFADVVRRLGTDGPLRRIITIGAVPIEDATPYEDLLGAAPPVRLAPGDGASAGDALVLLYTSGSSSRPKAVPLDQAAVIENGFNIGERQGLVPGDRVLIAIPLFWSYGAVNALPAAITHGATLVLQSRFEPGGALDLIERHRCTAIYTLPAMTNALVAHADFAQERTRSLRTGLTIGSPQDVMKAATVLGAGAICNIYGSTETCGNCCVTPHDWPLARRAASQGPPLPGMRLRIRHPLTGALAAAGEVGQIEVSGHVTRGYRGESARHNSDVLTADGWFRTGDLGALQADGALVYAGRSSEMIKRSGINVSPAEVEEVLQQHPDVGLAGVTGLADAARDEIVVAFVVPRPGRRLEAEALIAHCRARLSSYKVPDRILLSVALPLTPTGKLMRRELKALAAGSAAIAAKP